MLINMPHIAVCQNLVPLVNIKIAGKWMFIPLKMVLIGIDLYPYAKKKEELWMATTDPVVLWSLDRRPEGLPRRISAPGICEAPFLPWDSL